MTLRQSLIFPLLLGYLLTLSSCAIHHAEPEKPLATSAPWVIMPFINYSQTPQAGERAEAIAETLLRSRGIQQLSVYPQPRQANGLPLLDEQQRYQHGLSWARRQGARYGVTGTVEEWRYKAGLDGEPAVGISLRIVELPSATVIWSASGARAGWARESLSGTGQKVLQQLVDEMNLE